MMDVSEIAGNLAAVRSRIVAAAQAVGRLPDGVQLIAVSKMHPPEVIHAALVAGQRDFGENRVQEAMVKFPALKAEFPDMTLHLIGALQTNKAIEAVRTFDVIQSLDRPKLAIALAAAMIKVGRRPDCYIQVNIGEEPQKAGVLPSLFDTFLAECRDRHGLPVVGLMCIPPADQPPERYFSQLRDMAVRCGLSRISMGMSGDYETAIALGATAVRVGTAIFGTRAPLA